MPAVSKSQQRLFGMLHAYQTGTLSTQPSARLKKLRDRIDPDDVLHFAETKRKGLPEHVKKAAFKRGFMRAAGLLNS